MRVFRHEGPIGSGQVLGARVAPKRTHRLADVATRQVGNRAVEFDEATKREPEGRQHAALDHGPALGRQPRGQESIQIGNGCPGPGEMRLDDGALDGTGTPKLLKLRRKHEGYLCYTYRIPIGPDVSWRHSRSTVLSNGRAAAWLTKRLWTLPPIRTTCIYASMPCACSSAIRSAACASTWTSSGSRSRSMPSCRTASAGSPWRLPTAARCCRWWLPVRGHRSTSSSAGPPRSSSSPRT